MIIAKRYYLSFLYSASCFFVFSGFAFGIISDFEKYADEVRSDGTSLLSLISPFKEYNELKLRPEEMIRVIVVGAVSKPGIYHVKIGASMRSVVENAMPFAAEGFQTKAYRNSIKLYRIGAAEESVKMNLKEGGDDRACLEGDVLKVLAIRF